jgi:hypothetical protein
MQDTITPPEPTEIPTPVGDPDQERVAAPASKAFRHCKVVRDEAISCFIRLPNQFQHGDISTKARAAKARRMRQLRDPETDAFLVLDDEMDELRRANDRTALIDEIVGKDWYTDHKAAVADVQEQEEYAHADEDEARLFALRDLNPDQRDADEYGALERHLAAYSDAVTAAREERQGPRRRALEDVDLDDLIQTVREDRIAAEGRITFDQHFSMWEWFVGTFHVEQDDTPGERYFNSIEEVQSAPAEVLEVLRRAFTDLESAFGRGLTGNS